MSVAHNVSLEATATGGFIVWYGRGRVCRIVLLTSGEYKATFTDNGLEHSISNPAPLSTLLEAAIAFDWD